jgi:hypothetical protein
MMAQYRSFFDQGLTLGRITLIPNGAYDSSSLANMRSSVKVPVTAPEPEKFDVAPTERA